jgi:hypothetical protein
VPTADRENVVAGYTGNTLGCHLFWQSRQFLSKITPSPKGCALIANTVVASPMVVRSRVASKLGDMAEGASDYLSQD